MLGVKSQPFSICSLNDGFSSLLFQRWSSFWYESRYRRSGNFQSTLSVIWYFLFCLELQRRTQSLLFIPQYIWCPGALGEAHTLHSTLKNAHVGFLFSAYMVMARFTLKCLFQLVEEDRYYEDEHNLQFEKTNWLKITIKNVRWKMWLIHS